MGAYTEKLQSGGELIVTESNWYISYYFPGPDMRYNGTFKRISANEIDKYISAWKNNFSMYLKLKSELSLDGTFEKIGEAGMKISIGGYRDGVCIDGWHMNVRSQEKIDSIIRDYTTAKDKAYKRQQMIKML